MEHVFQISDEARALPPRLSLSLSISLSLSLSGSAFILQTAAVGAEEKVRRRGQTWNACVCMCVRVIMCEEAGDSVVLRGATFPVEAITPRSCDPYHRLSSLASLIT